MKKLTLTFSLILSMSMSMSSSATEEYVHQFFPLKPGEQGIQIALINNITIPAGQKALTLFQDQDQSIPDQSIPYRWRLVFKKSSNRMRTLDRLEKFMIINGADSTERCSRNTGITYRTVKLYADHEIIDYIEYNSGAYIPSEQACTYRFDLTSDLTNRYSVLGFAALALPRR